MLQAAWALIVVVPLVWAAPVLAQAPLPVVATARVAAAAAEPAAAPPAGVSAPAWAQASCVAALEKQTEALAERIKGGEEGLTERLRERLRAAAAFVGRAYLDGERDEDHAKGVLRQARQALQALPPAELAARQEACAAQGARLLAETNVFSRMVVHRVAERRLKKLLGG